MTFYLTSTEYENLKGPFECRILENIQLNKRRVLLVEIEPCLSGSDYDEGLIAINKVFLLAKYKDKQLELLNNFPIEVHVIIPDNPNEPLKTISNWSKMKNIGWAELYDRLEQLPTN